MPRPRWPHLLREVSRHGTVTWVVRIGHGPRVRLRGKYGSKEFEAEYHAAIRGEPINGPRRAGANTLQWLWDRYRQSSDWTTLSAATKRQRENIMKGVLSTAGVVSYHDIDAEAIVKGREKRAATPSQANNFLNTMRSLFRWATENDYVKIDPTDTVKNVKRPRTEGVHPWSEAEIARFEERWPMGTRERLAFTILLYTGLRRGDAAALGPAHVADGIITVETEKTGEIVDIPILPELAKALAATKLGDRTFIAGVNGRPMTKESFGNWFKEACVKAGVPGSAHGLRKAGATRGADNGMTSSQLKAIFGWRGDDQVTRYTRQADRKRLAREAITKLSRNES